jgi:hypothetical protein
MKLRIDTASWKIVTKEDKAKTIGGTYKITCGPNEVASSSFNDGYGSTDIPIPAKLMAKAEELDEEIREAVIKHFGGEND